MDLYDQDDKRYCFITIEEWSTEYKALAGTVLPYRAAYNRFYVLPLWKPRSPISVRFFDT